MRVNAIAPAIIRTDFARALWENPEIYARATSTYPLRRIGEPEDVSNMVVFLASEAARHVTGQVVSVNGGFAMPG